MPNPLQSKKESSFPCPFERGEGLKIFRAFDSLEEWAGDNFCDLNTKLALILGLWREHHIAGTFPPAHRLEDSDRWQVDALAKACLLSSFMNGYRAVKDPTARLCTLRVLASYPALVQLSYLAGVGAASYNLPALLMQKITVAQRTLHARHERLTNLHP